MALAARRRAATRLVVLDRSLESLPLFRLSDSADDGAVSFITEGGGRWRVLPAPGERLPGTFDQDVYMEVMHRYHEAGAPADGAVVFTLHAFLRSMGRKVDGRTYEQLRSALARLERTMLESSNVYVNAARGGVVEARFPLLSSVAIDRRRLLDRSQFTLFPVLAANEPGEARVVLAPELRANIAAGYTTMISAPHYFGLSSPVARRLYRLLEVARANGTLGWRVALARLAEVLPLSQRYPSHLQRVLQPANEMLVAAGLVRDATIRQHQREWYVDYVLGRRA